MLTAAWYPDQRVIRIPETKLQALPRLLGPGVAALIVGIFCLFPGTVWVAEAAAVPAQMKPIPMDQIVTFLFLMLGPIKIIGPFAKPTQTAAPAPGVAITPIAFPAIVRP